jgi:UTP--glucose-1-phosphate uridylyltransferase
MKVKQALITDAGLASRFLPIVKSIPKGLIPIGNKPAMQLQIEECMEGGAEKIIIVCRKDTIDIYKDYFLNERLDLKDFLTKMGKPDRYDSVAKLKDFPEIEFVLQDDNLPYGTAAPIISAKSALTEGEPFFFLQGDDLVFAEKRDCQVLNEAYEADSSYAGYMMVQYVDMDKATPGGMVKFKEGTTDLLDFIVEKPKKEDAPSNYLSYGRFLYTPTIWDYMDPKNIGLDGEFWNVDALTLMAKEKPVKVVINQGNWVTNGDPKQWLKAQLLFATKESYWEDVKEYAKELIN